MILVSELFLPAEYYIVLYFYQFYHSFLSIYVYSVGFIHSFCSLMPVELQWSIAAAKDCNKLVDGCDRERTTGSMNDPHCARFTAVEVNWKFKDTSRMFLCVNARGFWFLLGSSDSPPPK